MKKYIIILVLSFFAVESMSQSYQVFFKDSIGFFPQTSSAVRGYFQGRWRADTLVVSHRDTTWHPVFVGTVTTPNGVALYVWDGTKWNALGGGGGGSGTVTSVGLTMPTGFSVANSPITTSGTLAVTTALNGIIKGDGSGFGTVAIGSNITYDGTTISSPTDWHITGNTGTTAGTNFVGTTNSQSLVFKVNNTNAGFIDNSATGNLSFGKNAFGIGVSGSSNTAYGTTSLNALTSGTVNTAIGRNSMIVLTEGSGNVGVGAQTFTQLVTGNQNTAVGQNALTFLGTLSGGGAGDGNIALGYNALTSVIAGDYNIGIGYNSGGSSGAIVGDSNIVIGTNAALPTDTGSNQLSIQNIIYGINNSGTGATISTGSIGIGIDSPEHKLDIAGDLRIQTITSGTAGTDSVLVQSGGIVKKISPTYYISGAPSLTSTQVAFGDGSNLMTSSSNLTYASDVFNILRQGLTTTLSTGINIENNTASTSGVPVQNSPSLRLRGNAWNLGGSGNDATAYWDIYTVPQSTFYDADEPNARGTLTFKNNALPTPVMTLSYNGNLSVTHLTAAGQVQGDYGAFNSVVGAAQLVGGLQYPSSQATYRTTDAGSDLTPQLLISAVSNGTGNPGFIIDRTTGLGFFAMNDQSPTTRRIMRSNIYVTDLSNTAGSEAGGLGFATQTGGAVAAERMKITPSGVVTIMKPLGTSGSTPSYTLGTGAGTGATASITGNDASGYITLNTGTTPTLGANIITITFSTALANTPTSIQVRSGNNDATLIFNRYYPDQATASSSSWVLKNSSGTAMPASAGAYIFYYTVTQ